MLPFKSTVPYFFDLFALQSLDLAQIEAIVAEIEREKEAEERANAPMAEPEQPKIAESTPASLAASALLGGAQPEIVEEKQKTSS